MIVLINNSHICYVLSCGIDSTLNQVIVDNLLLSDIIIKLARHMQHYKISPISNFFFDIDEYSLKNGK